MSSDSRGQQSPPMPGGQTSSNPSRSDPTKGPHMVNRGAVPAMPSSSLKPSREKVREEYTITEAFKSINKESFTNFHMKPCVRESLMTLIVGTMGTLGVSVVAGKSVAKGANWGVGVGVVSSFVAMHLCQKQRHRELEVAQGLVDALDRKKLRRAKEMREAQEARQKAAEEERIKARRWYKPWQRWQS